MEMESFARDVKEGVSRRLGKGYDVTVRKVGKNNGVVCTGLCVTKNSESLSPVVYIDSHYDRYRKGDATPTETVEYVVNMCRRKRPSVNIRKLLNYQNVRGSIIYSLINTDRNRELLRDIPHKEYLDLSIVFRCLVSDGEGETATIPVHNAHAKLWGVSVEELYAEASRNTPKLRGYEVKSMREIADEIMPDSHLSEDTACIPLYVLTNRDRTDGAACILYKDLMKDFSDALGNSFYIIPSSVHEVLLLPAFSTDDRGQIIEMIREVNDTQVPYEEILSYSLYYYDRDKGEACVCGP